jgi:integrase
MPSSASRIWEYGGYWIGRATGSDYFYACWWDKRAGRTRRRSLETKVLAEAQDLLIELAGSAARNSSSRSPDAILLVAAFDFYYENDVKFKPSAKPAFRAMQLAIEFADERIGPDARVSHFTSLRQREFMRWCVEKYGHSAGTIARNLSVASAAFGFCRKPQVVRDGFDNEIEVTMLDSAPAVCTQPKEVARLTELPESSPREWIPTFEELGRFVDAIDVRQENLFRFVMLALNTWARPEAIIDFRADGQVNWAFGVVDLNPPGRRQTKKHRPKIKLTDNLAEWLRLWDSPAPMVWDGQPVTTMKKTFKRHAVACGLPRFTQYSIRHFMATYVRHEKPPVSREQRDVWLGHDDRRTAKWYEHNDPEFLEDARRATDSIIEQLQRHTKRALSARKLRAKSSIRLISSKMAG